MKGWIILGAIVLVIVLILLLRVGIKAEFGDTVTLRLKLGPFKIQVLPENADKKPKKKKEKKKTKKPKKGEETSDDGEKAEKTKKKMPKLSFEDIRTVIAAAFTALYRALRKTRQRVRIEPLDVSVTFAGDDPAEVAQLYGWADTAMWTLMPRLEQVMRIPDPHIHLDADYQADTTRIAGRLGADLRVMDIFAILFAAVGPMLRWLKGYLKRQKAEEANRKQTTEATEQNACNKKG